MFHSHNPPIEIEISLLCDGVSFTSKRGAQKLVLEGFVYIRHKVLKDGDVSWKFELRHHHCCKVKVRIRGTYHLVVRTNDHTHSPVTGRPDAMIACNNMKCHCGHPGGSSTNYIIMCSWSLSSSTHSRIEQCSKGCTSPVSASRQTISHTSGPSSNGSTRYLSHDLHWRAVLPS